MRTNSSVNPEEQKTAIQKNSKPPNIGNSEVGKSQKLGTCVKEAG